MEIYPVGLIAGRLKEVSRMKDIIFPLLRKLVRKWEKIGDTQVNIVTSIEVAYPMEDYLTLFQEFSRKCNTPIYILTENLKPVRVEELKIWPFLTSINSLRYLAEKYLEDGLLIHMNSSSTLFIPVKNKRNIPLELHYSSGIGMWTGAIYRHVFNVTEGGVYIMGKKTHVSPVVGSILDILLKIFPEKARKMLEAYNFPLDTETYLREYKNRLMQIFGLFPERRYRSFVYGGYFDVENQVKVASYNVYINFLHALLENALKILSDVDIDMNKFRIITSGVGEPVLEDAFHLFSGYGEFKSLGVKAPGNGKAIVLGMNIPRGAKIRVDNINYSVVASYYYPGTPMVLTQHRGKELFVLMKCSDIKGLSSYLGEHGKVIQFNTWKDGNAPWSENINQMMNFILSLFFIILFSTMVLILLLSITHILGDSKGIAVLKAMGLPDSFISSLSTGNYLLLSLTGYLVGIFLGTFLGMYLNESLVSLPFIFNSSFLLGYNLFIILGIVIFTILPYIYVKRMNPLVSLRSTFFKISKIRYILVFSLLFFGILSPYAVSQNFSSQQIELPFDVSAYFGNVENVSIGEKAGYLYGVKVEDTHTDVYFMDYNSSFASTVTQGHWFSKSDEAVVGYALAQKYGLHPGSKMKIQLLGKWENYTVSGISKCAMDDYRAVYLPKVKYAPDDVIFIKTNEPEKIKKDLEANGFTVLTKDDVVQNYRSEVSLLDMLLMSLLIALIIIGILSIFTLIYMDIKRNEKVYATLKAMGVPDSHIFRSFSPIIGLSSLLALAISSPLAILAGNRIFQIILPIQSPFSVIPNVIFLGLVLLFLFLLFSVILLGRIMKKMDVITVLRE